MSESYRFVAVNEAALRGYGFSRAEFLSMTLNDIVAGSTELRSEGQTHSQWRLRKKDGTIIGADA